MQHVQSFQYVLPSVTYAASSRGTQTLRDLPKLMFGRFCHLAKIVFGTVITPTFTAVPTTVGNNNVLLGCDFWDGTMFRFQGGFNHMRAKERLSCGRVRVPDSDTNIASASSRFYRRTLHMGPPHMQGYPTDFCVPTGMLENGELRYQHGALTDISADTTVMTGTIRPVAHLALLDELRIPPAYQFVNQAAGAADINLAGRALYESVSLLNSSSFDAITVAGFGNIRLDLGAGDFLPNVRASDIQAGYLDDFAPGEVGVFVGDSDSASLDIGNKIVNRGTPTAVTSGPQDLQVVMYTPPDGRLSKLQLAESVCRLRWDGSKGTAVVLIGRILPQPATVVGQLAAKALGRIGRQVKALAIKTISKRLYTGPYGEFMGWSVKTM